MSYVIRMEKRGCTAYFREFCLGFAEFTGQTHRHEAKRFNTRAAAQAVVRKIGGGGLHVEEYAPRDRDEES